MAEIGGRSLLARVVDTLKQGCDRVAVNARPGSGAADFAFRLGLPLVCDLAGDPAGPLAGVKAGLAWARNCGAERLATAPCDTPFLPPSMVAHQAAAMDSMSEGPDQPLAAFVRTPEGDQPLCALWSTAAYDPVTASLAGGVHPSIRQVLAGLKAVDVGFEVASDFLNVNSLQDQAAALAIAAADPLYLR